MSPITSKCLSQVKLELKEVIENLKLLQNTQISDEQQLRNLKERTDQLLTKLEAKPLERIKSKLNRNQRKRQLQKLKKRHYQQKQEALEKENNTDLEDSESKPAVSHKKCTTKPLERSRKYHYHLKSLHECQRFLKTFELLEQLHLARGQDPTQTRKFSSKLQPLKLIWNCLLQERQRVQSNNEQHIEQQWNQVLFGVAEKTYFEEKPNLKYFLRKRHIWDSYIDNRHGTSIPIGWVLPPSEPNDKWSEYLEK